MARKAPQPEWPQNRALRRVLKLTQSDLAQKLDMSANTFRYLSRTGELWIKFYGGLVKQIDWIANIRRISL